MNLIWAGARPATGSLRALLDWKVNGRDDWIRTSDLTHPKGALYQAEPRPDYVAGALVPWAKAQGLTETRPDYVAGALVPWAKAQGLTETRPDYVASAMPKAQRQGMFKFT